MLNSELVITSDPFKLRDDKYTLLFGVPKTNKDFLLSRLSAFKTAVNSFVFGDAIGKPQGVITNANVATVNSGSGTLLTGDGLITLVHSIKSDYGQNATFMFNRTTLGAIRKLKDSAGQYVFQAGMMLTAGVPNSVLGYPYVEAPDLADVGSSAKPVIFGDFCRGYMVVDRVNLSVLRDPFTQATHL